MMTPMNKIFIEVIYLAFIDLGWKTYYHSYKCHYFKSRHETEAFIMKIKSNTC